MVFARLPRLGEVKTRLARDLGPELALRIYQACLSDSLARYRRVPASRRMLWITGNSETEIRAELEREGIAGGYEIRTQGPGDLGMRLTAALREAWEASLKKVVFLGADSPTLPMAYLARALTALDEVPTAIGPARDGGYYLLGLTPDSPEVFEGIPWGTDGVLTATLERLRGSPAVLLPRWYDVDHLEDLRRLDRDLRRASCCPALSGILAEVSRNLTEGS